MPRQITVYAVSDMTGETVARLVRAASAQFPTSDVAIKVLQHASSAQQVVDFIEGRNPPQLAQCELSLTKSTSAHIVQAHLAQCELR